MPASSPGAPAMPSTKRSCGRALRPPLCQLYDGRVLAGRTALDHCVIVAAAFEQSLQHRGVPHGEPHDFTADHREKRAMT